jgi:hypothetical protein
MSAADPHAALAEILRRGQAIINGSRLVGGPRAAAFNLASVAAKALGVTLPSADAELRTWEPEPEQQAPKRRRTSR